MTDLNDNAVREIIRDARTNDQRLRERHRSSELQYVLNHSTLSERERSAISDELARREQEREARTDAKKFGPAVRAMETYGAGSRAFACDPDESGGVADSLK